MAWEAKQAMFQTGAELLALKKRMEEVGQEQNDVLDWLLANMGDAELNARMMALTEKEETLKAKIAEVWHFIQKITVENAGIIYVHFRDSDVVLKQSMQ